jgi:hypothetical protein
MRVLRGTRQRGETRCLRSGRLQAGGTGAILLATSDPAKREIRLPTVTAPPKAGRSRRPRQKPSCESCYFGIRMLCALELGEPCSTFRPDSPHGLVPPTQPMLLIGADEAVLEPEPLAA